MGHSWLYIPFGKRGKVKTPASHVGVNKHRWKVEDIFAISSEFYMSVSKNRGTPKWMVYNGKPYLNGWFGGTTIFGNAHMQEGWGIRILQELMPGNSLDALWVQCLEWKPEISSSDFADPKKAFMWGGKSLRVKQWIVGLLETVKRNLYRISCSPSKG